jgi:hypothetical protein
VVTKYGPSAGLRFSSTVSFVVLAGDFLPMGVTRGSSTAAIGAAVFLPAGALPFGCVVALFFATPLLRFGVPAAVSTASEPGTALPFATLDFGDAVFFAFVADFLVVFLAMVLAARVFAAGFLAFLEAPVFALAAAFAFRGFLPAARFAFPAAVFAPDFLAPDFLLVLLRPVAIKYSSHFKRFAAGS